LFIKPALKSTAPGF